MSPRVLVGLFALAFVAAAAVGTHGLAYWDAGDYVRLALEGGQSGLLLGRPLFLAASRAIATAGLRLGLEPAHVEPLLRWTWTAASATAAPLLAVLGSRLGLSSRAAIASGIALAVSPSFAHTAHQVLTDGPALALAILALIMAADARPVVAGAILGCAIATRETAAVHLIAVGLLVGRERRRDAAYAVVTAIGTTLAIVVVTRGGIDLASWTGAMRRSSTAHPLGIRDVALSIAWVLAVGPLPVVLGARALARHRHDRLARVAWPAAIATVALLFYPDGAFSPRYVLATAPLAFLLVAGPALAARPRAAAFALVLPLAAVPIATAKARAIARRGGALVERLSSLPARALLVPGHFCPHARLALAFHRRTDVALVCPGWDWPDDVARVLEGARCDGRPIVLDLEDDAWIGEREIAPRNAVRAWAGTAGTIEIRGLAHVAPRACP